MFPIVGFGNDDSNDDVFIRLFGRPEDTLLLFVVVLDANRIQEAGIFFASRDRYTVWY